MTEKYILAGQRVVPCADLVTWARWFEAAGDARIVAQTTRGAVRVSTVFLGLDHRFGAAGPPLIFETMIFGGAHDGYTDRYPTWDLAAVGHAAAVALVSPEMADAVSQSDGQG